MTFANLTQADAIRIRDVLKQLEDSDAVQDKAAFDANIAIAQAWWDGVKPAVPTTRDEAVIVFDFIKGLIATETDRFRQFILQQKLREANQKFKDLKSNP